jgi:hypothetical protein
MYGIPNWVRSRQSFLCGHRIIYASGVLVQVRHFPCESSRDSSLVDKILTLLFFSYLSSCLTENTYRYLLRNQMHNLVNIPVMFDMMLYFNICCILRCLVCIVVFVLCILLSSYVYLLYYVWTAVFTLDAGLMAISQCSEDPATGHLDTGFSCFPVFISKCWDGSQDSNLPLHASHVALPT